MPSQKMGALLPIHYFIKCFSIVPSSEVWHGTCYVSSPLYLPQCSSEVWHGTCYVSSPMYIEIAWPIPLTANLVGSPESIIPDNSSSSQHTNIPTLKQALLTSLTQNLNIN